MDDAAPLSDPSPVPWDIIMRILESMSLRDRFTCALVCKAWAKALAAATHSILLRVQDLSSLQAWLNKHGGLLEVLQLHECGLANLNALPCPHLQDLLLHSPCDNPMSMRSRVWCDIAAATKITSVSLSYVLTHSQQADVVSALTTLPDLQRLIWCDVGCSDKSDLFDSSLLQRTTRLTYLELEGVKEAALQHLSCLTKLQHLIMHTGTSDEGWDAGDCPGLQELEALTSLQLYSISDTASVSQLTALQQLQVSTATSSAVTGLHVLTALTKLTVWHLADQALQMQLTGLQHLELGASGWHDPLPMSLLASCKQLRVLLLHRFVLSDPGSLVASTMLQHLELNRCRVAATDGAAGPLSWQQVLPGPEQLSHLTALHLRDLEPELQQSDTEHLMAACCRSLQVLRLDPLQDSFAPVLGGLPALTSLELSRVTDAQCGLLAQLTGLRDLSVQHRAHLSPIGLRQLAALEQLTSLGFGWVWGFRGFSPMLQRAMLDKLPDGSYAIVNKAPAGCPSDVPSRLLRALEIREAAGQ